MARIEVLGPGCANCQRLEALARQAVADLGVEADVEKVTDVKEIMAKGVMATPGLVVNGKVVSKGRVPPASEVKGLIADVLAEEASRS
jgi:small redox-active disulfide protein 2